MDKQTIKTLMGELGKVGGKARAKKLSKAQRSDIARMGGKAGGRGRGKKKGAQPKTNT